MTAYRVVVAERKDIVVISIVCDECSSVVSLNAETAAIPSNCASCGKQYSENIRTAIGGFCRFHRSAKAEEQHGKPVFRFEIKQVEQ